MSAELDAALVTLVHLLVFGIQLYMFITVVTIVGAIIRAVATE